MGAHNYCVSIKSKRPLRNRYGERVCLSPLTAKTVRKQSTRSAISTLSTTRKRRSTKHTHYWRNHTSALRSQALTLHPATTAHTRARLLHRFRLVHALPKPRQKTTSLSCATPYWKRKSRLKFLTTRTHTFVARTAVCTSGVGVKTRRVRMRRTS